MSPELIALLLAGAGEAEVVAYDHLLGEALLAPVTDVAALVVDYEPAPEDSATADGVVAVLEFEGEFWTLPAFGSKAESKADSGNQPNRDKP